MSESEKKAKELVERFGSYHHALLCVNNEIKSEEKWLKYFETQDSIIFEAVEESIKELEEVKQEIQKL